MDKSPLAGNTLWEQWKQIGDSAGRQADPINIAMSQDLIYFMGEPDAWAWRIDLPAGRQLKISCIPSDTSYRIFMDLFVLKEGVPIPEKSIDDSIMVHTSRTDQELILRIQPELFSEGMARLSITDAPRFSFPVQGARRQDIGSFWGDPRDAGVRKHEGVDIFAPRHTPALAAGEGRVMRTGEGGLGGKTVWLRTGGLSLYYAHLDSILVDFGQNVMVGDTIGFVGNTGNARTTPPHLHFGIYRQGALDPLPFIDFPNIDKTPIKIELKKDQKWGRIKGGHANVRSNPSSDGNPLMTLSHHGVFQIRGGFGNWYQIRLPDGSPGYIHQSLVESGMEPVLIKTVDKKDTLYFDYQSEFFFLPDTSHKIGEIGNFGEYILYQYKKQFVWGKGG